MNYDCIMKLVEEIDPEHLVAKKVVYYDTDTSSPNDDENK